MPPRSAPQRDPQPASDPVAVVLGVGNILFGDEGVGVYAAHALERHFAFSPQVEVVDGATLGFRMIDLFLRPTTLIVLDALAAEAEAGSIFRLPGDVVRELGPEIRPTAHEVDPLHLLEMAPLFGDPPELVLLGIVPATTETTVGLSPALDAAFPRFVEAAVSELRDLGVQVEQLTPPSLEDVIDSLVGGVR